MTGVPRTPVPVELMLGLRAALYRGLSPLDAAWDALRGRRPLPPLWLRRHVGAARRAHFEYVVSEGEKQILEVLGPEPRIAAALDLGCGCGAMAPFFQGLLPRDGRYLGVDIHDGSIRWCRRHYASDPRLQFGLLPAALDVVLGQRFDLILAKSLFTHLLEAQTAEYLSLIRSVLAPGGRFVMTAFLFDAESRVPAFPHRIEDGGVRCRRRLRPEAAVAYERERFLGLAEQAGLHLIDAKYWFWPGDHATLGAQDRLVWEPHA